ncbi:hypothetical protein EI94DRAFT_1831444 [Lactarius quietus]|nr:hypothetical protein EI94DRAFT_1831444 [Lactarius quietus]
MTARILHNGAPPSHLRLTSRRLPFCPRLQTVPQGKAPATFRGPGLQRRLLTNVLKNMPPPSLLPYKNSYADLLDSLLFLISVALTERVHLGIFPTVSSRWSLGPNRMSIVIRGASSERVGSSRPRAFSSFLPTQTLEPSYPPHAGASVGRTRVRVTRTISRELLIEVFILMLEYFEDQLTGGQSHVPRAARGADEALVRDDARSPLFGVLSRAGLACPGGVKRILRLLTPSKALRQRHKQFH